MSDKYMVAVDVGSAEVRAALISQSGCLINVSKQKISIWSPKPGYYQQSSANIWSACVQTIKEVCKGTEPFQIKGIGCDATCSLVAVSDEPITISPKGEIGQDIVMWMDHRAEKEAEFINTNADPKDLAQVGGSISLEMQLPKLLWLKKHLRSSFDNAKYFFDLPDYLTFRLTGSNSRSACSVVCKWLYQYGPNGVSQWNEKLLKKIGLDDLLLNNAVKIGNVIVPPGAPVGTLSGKAAKDLEDVLLPGIPVSASMIDAHAGGLGLIAAPVPGNVPLTKRLVVVGGTSMCHLAVTEVLREVGGVWGPYYEAMLPKHWVLEAGQSAAGQLLDWVVNNHPAASHLPPGYPVVAIRDLLSKAVPNPSSNLQTLAKDIHVYPDYRGNRSPLADPSLRGMVCGLDMTNDVNQLACVYLATVQALAYGTRQIIEQLEERGVGPIEVLLLCGGLANNSLMVEALASACHVTVAVAEGAEPVLLGAAALAASASQIHSDLNAAAAAIAPPVSFVHPDSSLFDYHNRKYLVFKKMQKDQLEYRTMMKA